MDEIPPARLGNPAGRPCSFNPSGVDHTGPFDRGFYLQCVVGNFLERRTRGSSLPSAGSESRHLLYPQNCRAPLPAPSRAIVTRPITQSPAASPHRDHAPPAEGPRALTKYESRNTKDAVRTSSKPQMIVTKWLIIVRHPLPPGHPTVSLIREGTPRTHAAW